MILNVKLINRDGERTYARPQAFGACRPGHAGELSRRPNAKGSAQKA